MFSYFFSLTKNSYVCWLGGVNEPVKLRKLDGTTYEAIYNPQKEGRHVVMITFAGTEIAKSPYEVNIGPYKETMIRAYGPGLVGGVVAYPALFTVETNGETGALGEQYSYRKTYNYCWGHFKILLFAYIRYAIVIRLYSLF